MDLKYIHTDIEGGGGVGMNWDILLQSCSLLVEKKMNSTKIKLKLTKKATKNLEIIKNIRFSEWDYTRICETKSPNPC